MRGNIDAKHKWRDVNIIQLKYNNKSCKKKEDTFNWYRDNLLLYATTESQKFKKKHISLH